MRGIIFRAKRTDNGEWVYGCLWNNECDGVNSILTPGNPVAHHVDPDTVGEWTGMCDKNGTKVFEGDIVKTQPYSDRPYSRKARYKEHVGVVEYAIRVFRNHKYTQPYKSEWIVKVADYGKYVYSSWSDFWKCEVIGNIYDNPDLIDR